MSLPYSILDVFTDRPSQGNPLAVVQDADHLTTEQMQSISREFNLSETVFLLEPKSPNLTARLRIFTPDYEMPFAGHPTIGTAALLCLLIKHGNYTGEAHSYKLDGDMFALKLHEEIGAISARGRVIDDCVVQTEFNAPKLPDVVSAPGSISDIALALGLAPVDIMVAPHQPRVISAGVPFTFVPLSTRSALTKAFPISNYWEAAFGDHDHNDAYVYWVDRDATNNINIHARMFAPSLSTGEDPATGSAVTALAAAMVEFDLQPAGWTAYRIEQGRDMGRPSQIGLALEMKEGVLQAVRISGRSVIVARGILDI